MKTILKVLGILPSKKVKVIKYHEDWHDDIGKCKCGKNHKELVK